MKKILIPTLLTVASTPLISLVGCGKNTFELKHHFVNSERTTETQCLRTENKLDLDKDKTYTALINVADFLKTNKAGDDLSFYVSDNEVQWDDINMVPIAAGTVEVDGHSLEYVENNPIAYQFSIFNGNESHLIIIGRDTLCPTSKIKITFSLSQSVQQYYLVAELFKKF